MFEILENTFRTVVEYGILAFEAVGVLILLIAAVRALFFLPKDKHHSKHILYDGISTALTFLLGSGLEGRGHDLRGAADARGHDAADPLGEQARERRGVI